MQKTPGHTTQGPLRPAQGRLSTPPSDRFAALGMTGVQRSVVVKGDPSKQISDVENVEIVFKDGVGYDCQKLLESVRGKYGQY